MKKLVMTVWLVAAAGVSHACDVCTRQQPKVWRGVTHGAGPDGVWDYVIVGATAVIGVIALFYATMWIVRPGEREPGHVKYSIFNHHQA
jgi:hypothetical protein